MSKSRLVFLLLSLAVMLPVISGALSGAATDDRGDEGSLSKHLSVFSEVLSLIRRAYVEETSTEELLSGALEGSTDALDSMATFVPADEVESFRRARQIGRRHSGLTVAKERGIAFVVAVDENSPGARAELQQGDIIARIGDRSTRRMGLWRLQSILAGEPGTQIRLEVLRRGQTHDIGFSLATYDTSPPSLKEVRGSSLLRISRFEKGDLDALRAILGRLLDEGRDSLLIDVRGVAGGSEEAGFALAGLFVTGALGELRSRDDASLHFQARDRPIWQGRTVVLIDGGTQGAAEIFASVLRQLAGSQLVGRRSFGYAGRQRVILLSDGSQVLLADAFYGGPDGERIDRSLIPDLVVSDVGRGVDEKDGEQEDPILERGLDALLDSDRALAEEVA